MTKRNRSNKTTTGLREQAERQLEEETFSPEQMSDEDLAGLVHELRVHQVELEMQNESLRQAQVDLEQSRAKYADLFDFAPVGYLVFDSEGIIVEANLTATGMLQMERKYLLGKGMNLFVLVSSRDTWLLHRRTVFESGQAQECELQIKQKDKAPMVVRLRSRPVTDEQGKVIQCRTSMTDITALAIAEQRLRDSEQRFRTLTENSPDIIARFDADLRIQYVNRSVETALGIPPADFVGKRLDEVGVPSDLINMWTREIEVVFKTGRTRQAEFSTSTTHGVRHYNAILVPEYPEDGVATTVLATVRDVTERVRVEERYRTIIANSQEGFAIIDNESRIVEINDALCRMVGRSREELLGTPAVEIGTARDQAELREHWDIVQRRGYDRFPTQHQRGDGAVIDMDIGVQRIDGDRFFAFVRDITEQRRAERDRIESLKRLELIAEAAVDGIWDWNLTTDTFWHNEAYVTRFGYDPADVSVSPDWWRQRIHPQDREQVLSELNKVLEGKQDQWSARYRFRRQDGSYAWVIANGSVLRDEGGRAVRMVGAMIDLTEKLDTLAQLERERTKLQTVLETALTGIVVTDEQARVVYANPMAQWMYHQPTPYGKPIEAGAELGFLHPDGTPYDPYDLPLTRSALHGETFDRVEMLFEPPDGQRRYLLASTAPLRDPQGEVTGAVAVVQDVTEQRQAEQERAEALQRFDMIARAANDGIWDWDVTADTCWHSATYAHAFGYAVEDVERSGDWWRQRIHPDDKEKVLASLHEAARSGGDTWTAKYRWRRKDGSYAWVMDRAYMVHDEQGRLVRMVGSTLDLTEKLELLGELESERTKLATVLDTVQSGIIVADAQGRPVYANPVVKAIHQRPLPVGEGLEAHAQMGLLYLDGTPYRPEELPVVRAAVNGETLENIEMFVERHDGERRHIVTNASPLRDPSGTIMGAVAALYDITEFKAIEQELRRARDELEDRVRERTAELDETVQTLQDEVAARYEAQERLMRQNELLQTIINNIPVMLCFFDPEARVGMINKEFERILGYSMKDFTEASFLDVCCPDPEHRRQVWEHLSAARPGWKEFLIQRNRGGRITSSWAAVRLSDGSYIAIGLDIRERKRSENRLRESEERYRALVEMSPDAICVEREGTIVFVNSTALKLFGAKRIADLIGRPLLDLIHPEDREMTQEQHATVQRKRTPLRSVEKRIVRLDGDPLHVEASAMPLTFEGKPAIQIVMHDITQRKLAEKRLRESARQLQQQARLLDLAHDSIMVHDMDGKIIFWNRGAEQTYGWSREEAMDRISHELLQTVFPHNLMEISARLLGEGRWDGELIHTTRSGGRIVVSSRWALQYDEDDHPIAILVIDRDITVQKQAERRMAEARQFAESVIDTVQEALLVLDAELRIVSANHTFYDTFRVSPEETAGQYIYEIGRRQWDIPDLRTLLEDILPHDKALENFEVEHDFEHIGHRTMLLNARRVFQETQETEMILLAIQDITVRKEQEQKILESQRQLAVLTEELLFAEERERHRLAVLLHDSIGQSLSFSKRELGVLQKQTPQEMDEIIEGIKEQIDVAIHQTRDLTFELSPTTLHTFGLEAAIEELGDQLSRRERFEFHFEAMEEELPLTEQVKTFLYRAVRELLMNVVKHAEAQNVNVRIGRTDDRIRIDIKDDGRGFDPSTIRHTAEKRKGFGILSIRERLTYLGGTFQIASAPGKGTEVILMAPLDTTRDEK